MDPTILKLLIALVPVVACLSVFVAVDVFKLTPLPEIGALLIGGGFMAAAAYYANGGVLDEFPVRFTSYTQYVAPPVEEAIKGLLVIGLFAFNRIGYLIDAAIAGFAIGAGFSLVEILTMCPTGWFIETEEAPDYLADHLAPVHAIGVLKDVAGDG